MNNLDTTYLCFITSDGEKDAIEIFKKRISENLWPIYHRTNQFRKIKKNIDVIFYLAGTGVSAQNFIGVAKIKKTSEPNTNDEEESKIKFYVSFKNIKKFNNYVSVKKYLNKLEFVNNKEKYGLSFQGGVTEVDEKSFKLLSSKGLE